MFRERQAVAHDRVGQEDLRNRHHVDLGERELRLDPGVDDAPGDPNGVCFPFLTTASSRFASQILRCLFLDRVIRAQLSNWALRPSVGRASDPAETGHVWFIKGCCGPLAAARCAPLTPHPDVRS
jgi:hypothetical protein